MLNVPFRLARDVAQSLDVGPKVRVGCRHERYIVLEEVIEEPTGREQSQGNRRACSRENGHVAAEPSWARRPFDSHPQRLRRPEPAHALVLDHDESIVPWGAT